MALPALVTVTLANVSLPPVPPPAGTQLQLQPCDATNPFRVWALPNGAAPGPVLHVYAGMCVTYDTVSTNINLAPCVPGEPSQQFSWDAGTGIVSAPAFDQHCWDVQYYGNSSFATLGLCTVCSPMSWNVFTFDAGTGQIFQNGSGNGTGLCVDAGTLPPPPVPTPQQLAWLRGEVGAMISYDLITQLTNESNPQHFCIGAGGDKGFAVPDPSAFNPTNLSTDNWVQAAIAMGASYSLLVGSHCSGFLLWPSAVYNYTVARSPWRGGQGDVIADYVASSKKLGLPFGFYLTWNYNYLFNAGFCSGGDGGPCNANNGWPYQPGQIVVNQTEFNDIMLATISEIWSRYPGELYEVWFDGSEHSDALNELYMQLQPQAVAITGTVANGNNARLSGEESGFLAYPQWDSDSGSPLTARAFVPVESDTPVAQRDGWFWKPSIPLRPLSDLQAAYASSVGVGGVLELGIEPDATGSIPDAQMQLLSQFGSWRARCYGAAAAVATVTNVSATLVTLSVAGGALVDRVVMAEDLSAGQRVLAFDVSATVAGGYAANVVPVGSGTAVGNKRIHWLSCGPMPVSSVTVNVTALRQPFTTVAWASVSLFAPCT